MTRPRKRYFGTVWLLIFALVLLAGGGAQAANITLEIDPQKPIVNESFQLLFKADGPVDAEPNFSELEPIVDILRRNRQTSIQWINGRNSHTTSWVLNVIVKKPGRLVIPKIAFGNDRSDNVEVQIYPRGGSNSAIVDTGLFLEIEVDKKTSYVQEQIILTARLLRRVELNDANLTDPSTDADAIIKRLGKDTTTQTRRNGKRYEVFERRFSIFPQTSGRVTINPLVLTTQIVQSSRSIFDPFRQSLKTRRVESNQIELQVKPIPPSFSGDTWLPAKRLRLTDDWDPNEDPLTAGEPLTRTVFLWAEGLNSGQLPEVRIKLPDGIKIYPDQPQTSEQETESGFSAVRQQKYAIIPHIAGRIVFPEVSVKWWNTETDQMEVARIDERPFVVDGLEPSNSMVNEPTDPTGNTAIENATNDLVEPEVGPIPGVSRDRLFIFAVVCLIGWIATVIAWWTRSRRGTRTPATPIDDTPSPALSRARRDVLGACKANDPSGAKAALIAWGRGAYNEPRLMSLGELINLVAEPLAAEIRRLDEYLYGQNRSSWDQFALREAFEHADNRTADRREMKQTVNPLPDLYRLSGR